MRNRLFEEGGAQASLLLEALPPQDAKSEGKRDGIINLLPSYPCPLQLYSCLKKREVSREEQVAGVGQAGGWPLANWGGDWAWKGGDG